MGNSQMIKIRGGVGLEETSMNQNGGEVQTSRAFTGSVLLLFSFINSDRVLKTANQCPKNTG